MQNAIKIEVPQTYESDSNVIIANAENLGLIVIDSERTILCVNDLFYSITGFPASQSVTGLKVEDILQHLNMTQGANNEEFPAEDLPARISRNFAKKEVFRAVNLAVTRDGRQLSFNSYYAENGLLYVSIRDVSENQKYRDLIEMSMKAAKAGFWAMNFQTGKFTYSDSLLTRLTPAESEKIQKHGIWSLLHKDDLVQMTKVWQDILEGRETFDMTYRVVTENNDMMWHRSVGKINYGSDGTRVGATAFITDITDDVKKQNDLTTAREASKAKSEFLARMSHEIRTPLNAIIGMSDSLKDENLPDDIMEVIDDIETAADGLHHLLSRTLDHAKLVSNKMKLDLERANIREIAENCLKIWRPQSAAKNVKMTLHVDPATPDDLLLDGFRVSQCLNNLLSNAVKFTETGRIDVIAKPAVVKNKSSLVLAVKDSGIGMSGEEAETIFEAFVQADNSVSRKYGGTGLGMSITKQLTELMGGQINVSSIPDQGTTFIVILPIAQNADDVKNLQEASVDAQTDQLQIKNVGTEPAPIVSMPKAKPFEGMSVLCVEDNPVNQKVVKRLIGKSVSSLTFANNGQEALETLSHMHVDIVLMDIHMPVMDGIEATLKIRGSEEPWANVVIIALTADPEYQHKRICKNIGMDDTIAKPVRREDIFEAFDRVVGDMGENFGTAVKLAG